MSASQNYVTETQGHKHRIICLSNISNALKFGLHRGRPRSKFSILYIRKYQSDHRWFQEMPVSHRFYLRVVNNCEYSLVHSHKLTAECSRFSSSKYARRATRPHNLCAWINVANRGLDGQLAGSRFSMAARDPGRAARALGVWLNANSFSSQRSSAVISLSANGTGDFSAEDRFPALCNQTLVMS